MSHVKEIEIKDALDILPAREQRTNEPPESIPPQNQAAIPQSANDDPCSAFRQMTDLHPNEVAISIVGDSTEAGLTGNSMLEITARGITRRIALAEFGLVDRRSGVLNKQAAVLLGLAHGKKILRSEEKHAATMTRLRIEFKERLGVKANPFSQHSPKTGWSPLFSIADLRGRADERARQVAERRTVSFDQLQEQGQQFASPEIDEDEAGCDEADRWLKENDL